MFSTLYLGPGVCALFVPLLLVLGHSPFGLLHTCHLHSCKNSFFDYQRASDSIIFTVMDKEMQSVSLICTEVLIIACVCVFAGSQVTIGLHTSAVSSSRPLQREIHDPACL